SQGCCCGDKMEEENDVSLMFPFSVVGDAIISEPSINFDLIFENLKDLNALAGEGMSKIEHTSGGARLRQMDSVPLTFYRNGIVMFNGPFRSYEEPSTQVCISFRLAGAFRGDGGNLKTTHSAQKEMDAICISKGNLDGSLGSSPGSCIRPLWSEPKLKTELGAK
uniref:UBX domain protein 11 n=1 Tax=Varanus komodoensis TaxID=61221 RepID=A0A8D2KUJ1_VARKO